MGRRPIIVIGWIIYALVYLGMAEATAPWQFWALFNVYGVYYGMTEGVEKALVADFVPSADRGTAFGIYYGATPEAPASDSVICGECQSFPMVVPDGKVTFLRPVVHTGFTVAF